MRARDRDSSSFRIPTNRDLRFVKTARVTDAMYALNQSSYSLGGGIIVEGHSWNHVDPSTEALAEATVVSSRDPALCRKEFWLLDDCYYAETLYNMTSDSTLFFT